MGKGLCVGAWDLVLGYGTICGLEIYVINRAAWHVVKLLIYKAKGFMQKEGTWCWSKERTELLTLKELE